MAGDETKQMGLGVTVTEWLLDSDPAIRWQVMRDLTEEPEDVVTSERARVATEGWGARLLALQGRDGQWAGGAYFPSPPPSTPGQPWTATAWSLALLRIFGLDPDSPEAQRAVAMVRENCRWEHAGQRFFDGEVEPCVNGLTVAIGSYFGQNVPGVVDRLLSEQMADGGWNCEQENGSTRGSFHTTISVLEGLLEHQRRSGHDPTLSDARARGEEYLLERQMYRRLSTGEVIDDMWTRFSFPTWWHYDVLRGLDYLRSANISPEKRIDDAIDLVLSKRGEDGRWPRENIHPGDIHFEIDGTEREPSRWNTLRAIRVLKWARRTLD